MTNAQRKTVEVLLADYGRTYAEEAGITPADKPSPLYQLLVLSTLLSARINAGVAVAAAKELFASGYRTPETMAHASWQNRVDALGRGHYRRYDERTSTMLGEGAELLLQNYDGDLRKLRSKSGNGRQLTKNLQEFPGIGPTGAAIFCREVQAIWPEYSPYLDAKVMAGARLLGLPGGSEALAELAPPGQLNRLAAACVRAALDKDIAAAVRSKAGI